MRAVRNSPARIGAPIAIALALVAGCGGGETATTSQPTNTAPSASQQDTAPIPMLVDYSPTLSDVTALLYLAEHPGVDLRAVTLAGTGESHCDAARPNTLALLALAGLDDVPVVCGPSTSVGPGNEWPEEWRQAADALDGLEVERPVSTQQPSASEDDAPDLVAETARTTEGLVVVALGPLTNLALAVDRHPQLVDELGMVYSMGGAFDVAGNAPNGSAEWNYFADPTAVDVVVKSGLPLTIVPLDATDHVPVTEEWFSRLDDELDDRHGSPSATAVFDLFRTGRPWDTGFSFWDELTAAIAVDESLAVIDERQVAVVTDASDADWSDLGRTVTATGGDLVRVASQPDRQRFEAGLLGTLTLDTHTGGG